MVQLAVQKQTRVLSLFLGVVLLSPGFSLAGDGSLPVGSNPPAIVSLHFPSRMHAFVWRNWQLVELDRLARVLETRPENVSNIARSMGLPPSGTVTPKMREQGYITIVRRNWHLLPYDQLLTLLDIDRKSLAFRLIEDDFLYIKLGSLKPKCEPLAYHEPTLSQRERAKEIKQEVESHFGEEIATAAKEQPFDFVKQLSKIPADWKPAHGASATSHLRFLYSYFGSFGDPLISADADPYPDGLLARLSDVGVNGVWLHIVLRNMAPGGPDFPEFGQDHELRLKNLRALCQRAKRFGIGVYLYTNEPRGMEPEFFKHRPQMAGVQWQEQIAMCTSDPRVRKWLGDAMAHVFHEVPELGGVFTITASENLTNCWSRKRAVGCPRCQHRSEDEVIIEVNRVIAEGVHRGNPNAKVICWDWGWHSHRDASSIIDRLPSDVLLMSVSEWAKPIVRGGVETKVGEYSISAVGPGPRAMKHWETAKKRGLKTVAKVQFNNTWELSSVPYLPVMDLVARHCKALTKHDVDSQMLSWTLGGYPSPNLRIAQRFSQHPNASADEVLSEIASDLYGAESVPELRSAWRQFSEAFEQFPLHGAVLYRAPQQMGPANLLYWKPTGYKSTMVGIPYDDLKGWRAVYPEDVFVKQFQRIAEGWQRGLVQLKEAVAKADAKKRDQAIADVRVAEAAGIHFQSVANQAQFIRIRDTLAQISATDSGLTADREQHLSELRSILDREIDLAKRLWRIVRTDSRIGFEASNHYFYTSQDLVEKVINCQHIRNELAK